MSKGDDTRQAILDHATELATRVGLEGLSIGALAQDLQMSKSGLFAHFQSKEALQLQVIEHAVREFLDGVIRPALMAPRGEPRVRAVFERWLEWVRGRPGGCFFVAMAIELDDRPGPTRERVVQTQRDWMDIIATTVRTAVAEGHFRPEVDPEQFAFDLYGAMLAYHLTTRLLNDSRAEARVHGAFEALLAAARRTGR